MKERFTNKITVLSCFDGMSCGQIAFERAGIKVKKYYASEIDKYAIKVTQTNYPDTIQLGSITEWKSWNIEQPDIIIGGSPCQGFSFAGKQLNFEDERSKLFFTFVDILKHYKPKYFLLENVVMKKEYANIISDILNVKPIKINSSLVSAQNRKRLYWTNIEQVLEPENKGIVFNDIIDGEINEDFIIPEKYIPELKADINKKHDKPYRLGGYCKQGQGQRVYSIMGKSVCLSALGGGWGAKTGLYFDKGIIRKPTRYELEKLQTVDTGYTSSVNYSQAAKMLGNGWTVDVIVHIFGYIRDI